MVVIRLSRGGTKKQPKYRIAVADQRRWRDGRFIEIVGNYNPHPHGQEKSISLDQAKLDEWLKKGAQPTARVKRIIELAKKAV
jgi:small subunit ribosomal protein S16